MVSELLRQNYGYGGDMNYGDSSSFYWKTNISFVFSFLTETVEDVLWMLSLIGGEIIYTREEESGNLAFLVDFQIGWFLFYLL